MRDEDYDEERSPRSAWSSVGALTVAAAVGAGVALLFSTETGEKTRRRVKRQIRDMELRDRAEVFGAAALEGIEVLRGRRHHRNRTLLYTVMGTAAGAALAATLAPESTRRARAWVEDTLDELRHNASTRWNMHRTRREHRMTPDTVKAIQRLEEKVEVKGEELKAKS
jgi:gas vesicle protein